MAKKRKVGETKSGVTRKDNQDRKQAIELYCQAIMDGQRQRDAYRIAHPNLNNPNDRSVDVLACLFAKHPDVQERMNELRKEMQERHANFRDHLVEMLTEEIDSCYADNKTLSPVIKQVEIACRVLGMDKQTVKVEGEAGAFDRDAVSVNLAFLVEQAKKGAK